jgi:hypothetical protein
LAHHLGADVGAVDQADCDHAPIAIDVPSLASNLLTIDQAPKRGSRIIAAPPWPTIAVAHLRVFDSVDAPNANPVAIREFEGVAVDDTRPNR